MIRKTLTFGSPFTAKWLLINFTSPLRGSTKYEVYRKQEDINKSSLSQLPKTHRLLIFLRCEVVVVFEKHSIRHNMVEQTERKNSNTTIAILYEYTLLLLLLLGLLW